MRGLTFWSVRYNIIAGQMDLLDVSLCSVLYADGKDVWIRVYVCVCHDFDLLTCCAQFSFWLCFKCKSE